MDASNSEAPGRARREAGLFGRRKGKTLRRYQAGLIETLLPRLRVDLGRGLEAPNALYPAKPTELHLEIGFGGGEHLVADAVAHPERGYFGCEPFVNGVAKLLAEIETRDLQNIRIHPGDAGELIDALPDSSLAGVCLLYPDPWPKRRHRERRFVSDAILTRLARVMRRGAELRFATDIDDYAGWTLVRVLRSANFIWKAKTSDDWLKPWSGWSGTRYEDKAFREGRRPVYLTFIRR
jgi:tRNA (guanine-N7-)-methyltransferase